MAVSDTPWGQFTQADYTPAQWRRACLVDTGQGDPESKARYKVPVREPDGTINRNGVHAAAGGHGLGAVQGISTEERRRAARALMVLYRQDLNEEPPPSLIGMAGQGTRSVEDEGPAMNGEVQYRTFTPDLEVRSGGDGRTIYGIAVPWNAPTRIHDRLVETFARGAFNHQFGKPSRVRLAREHLMLGGTLIGALSVMKDDARGQYVEARVSRTPAGEETLELVKDGAMDQLSIGFRERQNRRLAGGVTERVKADMLEVAITMEGAYGELAAAAGVRSAQIPRQADDLDLLVASQEILEVGLPPLPDHDLELRAIRLGMPW